MKNLRCWAVAVAFLAFGAAVQTAFATEPTAVLTSSIELEGLLLDDTAMEAIEGGLPRACHHPEYDKLDNSCLNNKGQKYIDGVNDCDIWLEETVENAGYNIRNRWGPAKDTKVKGHEKILANELTDTPPKGWSIEFISYGPENGHVALVNLKDDGSADVYHQGSYINSSGVETWESHGIHYPNIKSHRWGESRKYWDFD